jgi:hypothetical protein
MTFTISESQLLQWVFAYFAIHLGLLYLAMKWWSPKLPMVLWRERYLPAPVAEKPVATPATDIPENLPPIVKPKKPDWRIMDDCITALVQLGHRHQDARRIVLNVIDADDTVESVIAKAYQKPKVGNRNE